jgi:hypothetical protein
MGWFSWTRKNKSKPISEALQEEVPQTPHQVALLQKFTEEINKLYKQRNIRRTEWIRKLNRKTNKNNQNSYIYSPYENEAIVYLIHLLRKLEKDPNPFFFNEAYAEFVQTKNQFVKNNTNIFSKRNKSVPLINSVLRKMRVYSKQLENTTNNWNNRSPRSRSRIESFDTFSNTESNLNTNTSGSSLPSLQQLRENTRYRPTRRLKGRIVKSNPNTQPPKAK